MSGLPGIGEPAIAQLGRSLTRQGIEPAEQLAQAVALSDTAWDSLWRDLARSVDVGRGLGA